MSQLVIDEEMRAQLTDIESAAEVRDASGKIVGYFISPESYSLFIHAWRQIEQSYLDELDRRNEEKDVGTLLDLWKELGVE